MKLTVKECDNAKAKEKVYRIPDGRGLNLEIRPNGGKYWRMRYRYLGKAKMLALGVYPEVSLKEARDLCTDARRLLSENIDPTAQKKETKRIARENADNSFEVIAREWHENKSHSWTARHAKTVLNRLQNDIFPEIGHLPIADIAPSQLLAAIKKIEARGAHEPAWRMKQTSGQIFRYAIAKGIADRNPAADIGEALKPHKQGHYACIELKELPELLTAMERNEACLRLETRLAMRLLMLTMTRTKEVIEAKWEEFDFEGKIWRIPAERMKMRKEHLVPLSDQSLRILKELKEMHGHRDWIFPNQREPRKHMSNNTILKGLDRLGFKGRMTGHGFRSLAMTALMERLGYRYEVPDRQLAHSKRGMAKHYDRTEFLDERTKMMQEWADYLDNALQTGEITPHQGVKHA